MKRILFIELIEHIGFVQDHVTKDFLHWTHNDYTIILSSSGMQGCRWGISKDESDYYSNKIMRNWLILNGQRNFSLDDIDLLKEYFKPELRELKLKELGVY